MIIKEDGNTYQKILLSLLLCVFFPAFSARGPVFAQAKTVEREDLWICPGAEVALYSVSSVAYGGGLTLGYGNGASIGINAAYLVDAAGEINTMELNLLLRLYFLGSASCSGPYIQINGGPAFFNEKGLAIPSEFGSISAGLSLGWRFLIGRYLFIEPVIRGGYPYIVGGSLFAGVHF